MDGYEFLDFTATPNEKHVGIAKIRIDRRFMVRLKIMNKKDGGLFAVSASYKLGSQDGKDNYVNAFEFDSNDERGKVNHFVIQNVVERLNGPETKKQTFTEGTSAFGALPSGTYVQTNLPF